MRDDDGAGRAGAAGMDMRTGGRVGRGTHELERRRRRAAVLAGSPDAGRGASCRVRGRGGEGRSERCVRRCVRANGSFSVLFFARAFFPSTHRAPRGGPRLPPGPPRPPGRTEGRTGLQSSGRRTPRRAVPRARRARRCRSRSCARAGEGKERKCERACASPPAHPPRPQATHHSMRSGPVRGGARGAPWSGRGGAGMGSRSSMFSPRVSRTRARRGAVARTRARSTRVVRARRSGP